MKTGEKIKKKRKQFNYSLRELSELTKIPLQTLSSYERGTVKNISHDNLKILANTFFTDINYFILDSNNERSYSQEKIVEIILKSHKEILTNLDILEEDKLENLFFYIKNYIKKNAK